MAKPIPLGAQTTSAGSFIPIVATAILSSIGDGFNELKIAALPGNAGPVYITNTSAAPNTTTYSNIVAVLANSLSASEMKSANVNNDNFAEGLYFSPSTTGYGIYVVGKKS